MPRKRTRKEWIEHGERASRAREPKGRDLAQAKRVFSRELSTRERFELVADIVATRGNELCRAYRGVCQVSAGYKIKTTGKKHRRPRVQRTPAVVFFVHRKWRRKRDETAAERIPAHVLAYVTVGRRKTLCAVPTDIVETADHSSLTLDASIELVPKTGDAVEPGSIACAIRRSSLPDRTYIVSARHVLSASTRLHGTRLAGSLVRSRAQGRPLALTQSIAGALVEAPGVSLDAQLARVTHPITLTRLLADLRGAVKSAGEIPNTTCFVLTSTGPVSVKFATHHVPGPAFDYGTVGPRNVEHEELLSWQFTSSRKTSLGDSGSPVTTERDGGLLLGMHIGSNRTLGLSYAVPAWQLLSPGGYAGAGSGDWELLSRSRLGLVHAIADPLVADLLTDRTFNGSVRWRLTEEGIRIGGRAPETTRGRPTTVERIWNDFGDSVARWGERLQVPVELIIATICTESSGNAAAVREEPGYRSDTSTPSKVSVGLMQTLISTARSVLPAARRTRVTRRWLTDPDNSIHVGTAYIAKQRPKTGFDPPKVACAYNAGGVYRNNGLDNRWRMRQFPIGTAEHADRFVRFFNDVFRYFDAEGETPSPSFREHL